jgi:transposase
MILEKRGRVILPGYMASANAFMDNIGFVEIINDALEWDEKQWHVPPGILLKAVVLNTFTNIRSPLYTIGEDFKNIDTERLFGKGVTSDKLNDSAIGTALDRLYEANAGKLFQTLSLIVYNHYELTIKRLHSDTTTISFFGNYEEDQEKKNNTTGKQETININYGHNKDHRPDCKQMKLGQISNEAGIMINCQAMDGNTSDVNWNKEALKLVKDIQKDFTTSGKAIYVADCKLMTKKLFLTMTAKDENEDDNILFISRLPASFDHKLQARIRKKAYEEDNWEKIGKLSKEKKGCTYKIQAFKEKVYGVPTRLVVVKSSVSLASHKASLKKRKLMIEKAIKKLNKEVYDCKDDAEKTLNNFRKKYRKDPYIFSMNLEEIRTEKRPRGNPGKNPKPPKIIIKWGLKIKLEKIDKEALRLLRHKAESFVIISNVPEFMSTAKKLLEEYKGQIKVELNFKVIKSPALTSTIFLKKEERIEAMVMLLGVSLLLRGLILYKLRKGFEESGDHNIRIGYSGTILKTITMGLFKYAMNALTIEKQDDGTYEFYIDTKKRQKQRVLAFLRYLDMEISDLL